jgi:hypothetical protein
MHQLVRWAKHLSDFGNSGELDNAKWVDASTGVPEIDQDGSSLRPYKTIQQALNFIPKSVGGLSPRVVWTVWIAAGTYDEDLVWDVEGRRIRLMAMGPVNLGLFDDDTWQPTAIAPATAGRRHITVFGDGDNVSDNIRDYVSITALTTGFAQGAVNNSFHAFRISGQILVTATTTGSDGNIDWDLQCEVYGTTGDETGASFDATLNNPNMTINMFHSRMRGAVNTGTDAQLAKCVDVGFQGHVDIETILHWDDCEIEQGISLVDGGFSSNAFPTGLFNCSFFGTLTTATANTKFEVDMTTYRKMVENNFILPTDINLIVKGSIPVELFAGGGSPTSGQFYEYHAPASGSAGAAAFNRQTTLPEPVKLFTLVWDTASADVTTELAIRVAGVIQKTVTLDGAAGSLDLVAFLPAGLFQTTAGDTISVEYTGTGTAPGAGTVKVMGL